ncbi:MAG: class I SAM-dependent methyltransferase [Paracoccaceae bacterium]|nr:class I SAM-dependent methyltransferase [Paracoccaceae bacterium]
MSVEDWTERESAIYRALSEVAVPERERQIAVMVDLVSTAPGDGDVLEICCGEGLLTAAIQQALPGITVHAYDGSASMLEATRDRAPAPGHLVTREIDIADRSWRRFDQPLRAVVSSLAVHHLDGPEKRVLFADIHGALAPGGVFALADVIQPATRTGQAIAAGMWDQEAKRRSAEIGGAADGFAAFRDAGWNHFHAEEPDPVDKPSRLTEHVDWLREAGFVDLDLHWMLAGQMLLSGWKAG